VQFCQALRADSSDILTFAINQDLPVKTGNLLFNRTQRAVFFLELVGRQFLHQNDRNSLRSAGVPKNDKKKNVLPSLSPFLSKIPKIELF